MTTAPDPDTSDQAPMGPANGALRFVLELVALWGIVRGGAALVAGPAGWALGVVAGATVATVWGRFRVDADPGPAPVVVPGGVRLALELTTWLLGGLGLAVAHGGRVVVAYAVALVVHHVGAVPRLRWLLAR